jgi:hypothetical protein
MDIIASTVLVYTFKKRIVQCYLSLLLLWLFNLLWGTTYYCLIVLTGDRENLMIRAALNRIESQMFISILEMLSNGAPTISTAHGLVLWMDTTSVWLGLSVHPSSRLLETILHWRWYYWSIYWLCTSGFTNWSVGSILQRYISTGRFLFEWGCSFLRAITVHRGELSSLSTGLFVLIRLLASFLLTAHYV